MIRYTAEFKNKVCNQYHSGTSSKLELEARIKSLELRLETTQLEHKAYRMMIDIKK